MKLTVLLFAFVLSAAAEDMIVHVGTYTRQSSKGIYAFRMDKATGKLTSLGLAAETQNPTFQVVHPNGRFLYAANETNQGMVSAFSIDAASGALKLLNSASTKGNGPCHVSLDKAGKWLYAANYGGGSVAAFPVHDDGTVGEASAFFQHAGSSVNAQRQAGPHAHIAALPPDSRYVFVADLGLDEILSYHVDASKGGLAPNDPPFAKVAAGSGPRHVAFRPDGKFAYVINEMLSTVTAFRYDAAHGSMQEIQTLSALPADFTGRNSGAEIAVHPSGKFLYSSNRGHDSIAIFKIDSAKGTLTATGHTPTQGKTPRNFAIDPSGSWLLAANQDSGNVVVFRIDKKTGALAPTGTTVEVPFAVCITFIAAR